MAVVADPPIKGRRTRSLRLGASSIASRPWILFIVATGGLVAWLFQPDRTVSGLARSFALPPLDVYSDAATRTRGWGVLILLLLIRWSTFALFVSLLVRTRPSVKQLAASFGGYVAVALSYAIPFNLGRTFLISSVDETSSLPALVVIAAPFVLVALSRLFTQLLLKILTPTGAKVGWLIPATSLALWIVAPQMLRHNDITSFGVLLALMVLSVQALLLASLLEDLRSDSR